MHAQRVLQSRNDTLCSELANLEASIAAQEVMQTLCFQFDKSFENTVYVSIQSNTSFKNTVHVKCRYYIIIYLASSSESMFHFIEKSAGLSLRDQGSS